MCMQHRAGECREVVRRLSTRKMRFVPDDSLGDGAGLSVTSAAVECYEQVHTAIEPSCTHAGCAVDIEYLYPRAQMPVD